MRKGATMPEAIDHCALNVALYGPRRGDGRWTMTERGGHGSNSSVQRERTSLRIGPSALRWDGEALVIEIDEFSALLPTRVRGEVRLHPRALVRQSFALDREGRHRWHPIAPSARVEVALSAPDVRWSGEGYFDSNAGERPLEHDFSRWNWSRAALANGRSAVLYDVERRDAEPMSLALQFSASGEAEAFEAPPRVDLPRTGWRLQRETRADLASDGSDNARLMRTLEDTPFYARSVLTSQLLGERVTAMHESLSLDRFITPACQWMLPFRMPRNAR